MRLLCVLFCCLVLPVAVLHAQDARQQKDTTVTENADTLSLAETVLLNRMQVIVGDIRLSGNQRTRGFIALREIPFRKGMRLPMEELNKQLVLAKQQLMNTLLFVDVSVYLASRKGNVVTIQVDMKERWYFFPLPYFRLVDRNFNQWWVDQKRSLDRVNYGIKFTQNNLTGRNDELNIWLVNGYTQQFTLRYNLPFFDKKLKQGFNIGFVSATQKEVNYATGNNKQLFYKQEEIAKKTLRVDLTYSYRPGVKHRHYFRVAWNDEQVADTILKINPLYFPNGQSRLRFLDFSYQYKYYDVDYIAYPTKGFLFEGNLYRRGLSDVTGFWQVNTRAVCTVPFTRNSFLHLEALATAKAPFTNYFSNERLLGYGFNQLRGLEYNVVDGMLAAALKTTVHKEVLSFIFRNPFPSKTHDKIPFRIFLKAYGDLGYAYKPAPNSTNTLNNTLLRTWGLGMDIVSIYDFVFKIEYSFNQLGKDGLYLQTRNDF